MREICETKIPGSSWATATAAISRLDEIEDIRHHHAQQATTRPNRTLDSNVPHVGAQRLQAALPNTSIYHEFLGYRGGTAKRP